MARHVPFDIVIGCISRLLDSVFFVIETDYRKTHNHSWRGTTFVIFISNCVQYAVDFFLFHFARTSEQRCLAQSSVPG
jgi:hypothetical protein